MKRQIAASLFACALAACNSQAFKSEPSTPVPDEQVEAVEPVDYVASFNEPFMRFVSQGDILIYSWPGDINGSPIEAERTSANRIVRFSGEYHRGPFTLEIERGQCFDSMSGFEFSHQARFTGDNYDGLMGCARLKSEPQPRE